MRTTKLRVGDLLCTYVESNTGHDVLVFEQANGDIGRTDVIVVESEDIDNVVDWIQSDVAPTHGAA